MSEQPKKQEQEMGALWRRTTATGVNYYTGVLTINGEKIQLVSFRNKFKKAGDNQPDWRIYKSVPRDNAAPAQAAPSPKPAVATTAVPKPVAAPRPASNIPVPPAPHPAPAAPPVEPAQDDTF